MPPKNSLLHPKQERDPSAHKETDFKDGKHIKKEYAIAVVSPGVHEILVKDLEPGESALIQGTTVRHALTPSGPIDWTNIKPEETGDRDVVIRGKKTIAKLRQKNESGTHRFLIDQDTTEDGTMYELIDGTKIEEEIRQVTQNIIDQFTPLDPADPYLEHKLQILIDANRTLSLDSDELLISNNVITDMSIGIKATKNAHGDVEYTVVDPLSLLDKTTGFNQARDSSEELLGFYPGKFSEQMNPNSIHSLIMRTALLEGKVETDSMLVMNTVRLITRLARDSSQNMITLGANGIGLIARQQSDYWGAEIVKRSDPSVLSIEDLLFMRAFLHIASSNNISDIPTKEFKERRKVNGQLDFVKKAIQEEFAYAAYLDPQDAIFYFFSYLSIGEHLSSDIDKSLSDYHRIFRGIPQNTLQNYLPRLPTQNETMHGLDSLEKVLPEEALDSDSGLRFFERAISICKQLYPHKLVYKYGNAGDGFKGIPVMRTVNAPKSMSEVFAVILLAANMNPPDDEVLENIVNNWSIKEDKEKQAPRTYNNVNTPYDRTVTKEEILKEIKEISAKISLPVYKDELAIAFAQEELLPL